MVIYIRGGGIFTKEYLEIFSKDYECIGTTTPEMYIDFLNKCMSWLPEKTHLCLILGATTIYDGQEKLKEKHRILNNAIIRYSENHPRIKYINIDALIKDKSDFTDGLNHYSSRIYYELSKEIIRITYERTGGILSSYSTSRVIMNSIMQRIKGAIRKRINNKGPFYCMLKKVYKCVCNH